MMMNSIIRKIVPDSVKSIIKKVFKLTDMQRKIRGIRKKQKQEIQILRTKKKIKIAFLVIHHGIWKYEELYSLFKNNDRFEPIIVIVPLVRNGDPVMDVFDQSIHFFKGNSNYTTVSSYDSSNKKWIDIKDTINPDIIFFTNPHKLTFDKYYIDHFTDKITCYVPYAFVVIGEISIHYAQDFHQYLWRYFIETSHHKKLSKKYFRLNNRNLRVTGYPGLDILYKKGYEPYSPWKKVEGKETKKIIWAPHHTIKGHGGTLDYSNFMESADLMFEILEKRSDIQMAFKPHPILRENLRKESVWGIEKTNEYYAKWEQFPNGQLNEGAYVDLFYHSDGMITDSASFIAEYLYVNKPCFFQMKDQKVKQRFNTFGQLIFDYLYQGSSKEDLLYFIENTIIQGEDSLKNSREAFFAKEIWPKNNKTATLNIYTELTKALC